MSEVQHARAVEAMTALVAERGFAGASVSAVCTRAKMSRQGFYGLFAGREECFLAVLDEGCRRTCELIDATFEHATGWREGLRMALAALLLFAEEDRSLARVCVVEAPSAGSWALAHRQRNVVKITRLVVERWRAVGPREPNPLATSGAMAGVLGLMQRRLLSEPQEPMLGLLGALVLMATSPYLEAPEAAAEMALGEALARELLAGSRPEWLPSARATRGELPAMLREPRAERARRCVLYLAEHPGASNRQVGVAVGIVGHSHISALLSRLERGGLLVKRAGRPGLANAWSLTPDGEAAVNALLQRQRSRLGSLPSRSQVPVRLG